MVTILSRLIAFLFCFIPSLVIAAPDCSGSGQDYECESASVCKDDVAAAMDMVESNGGGTVIIPAGNTQALGCNWSGESIAYTADGSVALIGSGSDSTVIRGEDLSLAGFFTFNNSQISYAIPRITIKNMALKGRMKANNSALRFWGAEELVIGGIHLETENSSTAGLMSLKAVRKGVISKSEFISDDSNASSCNALQSYGITPATLYSPYPIPTDNCYRSVCNCSVGSRAVWRSSSISAGNTVIARLDRNSDGGANINNAGGSGKGTVQGVYLYIKSTSANPTVDLASFSASGNSMTTNGAAQNIPVKVGHNWLRAGSDFTAFNIDDGQYLGVYLNNCTLAAGASKTDGGTSGSANWIASGDRIPATGVNFGTPQANNISLWADIHDNEGDAATCEDEWDAYWKNTTTNRGGGFFDMPQDHTWKPTRDDDEAIFVEDCQFKWYYAANESNWGSNARVVYRNNRFILPVGLNSACTKNASRITMKPGGNFAHIYDNYFEYYSFTHDTITLNASTKTISFTPDSSGLWDFRDVFAAGNKVVVSGSTNNNGVYTLVSVDKTSMVVSESVRNESAGNLINIQLEGLDRNSTMLYISVDALIYNNVFSSAAYAISPIMVKSYSDWVFSPAARPHHQHMWGNHCFNMYNAGGGDVQCNDFGSAKPYQSEVANGWSPLEFNAPEAGDVLYGFSEYPYPHPLTKQDPETDQDPDSETDTGDETEQSTEPCVEAYNAWQTPCSVHSAIDMNSVDNLLDDDVDTIWHHWIRGTHWVILDMGQNLTITKLRKYRKQWYSDNGIAAIYISTDTTNWGDSLGSLPAVDSHVATGWRECDITDKYGRYIKIVSDDNVKSPYWREIDLFVGPPEPSPDSDPETSTIAAPKHLRILH